MTLRVGVIGVGLMGSLHARNLAALPEAEVVAICDTDDGRARAIARELGGVPVGRSADALIRSADVEAIVIASPHQTHAALAMACLEAGKPVFCEKPLAMSAVDARAVAATEERARNRLLQLGFMREFDAAHQHVQDAIGSGQLGRAVAFHGIHVNPGVTPHRTVDDVLAGSVVHDIHSARWLLGSDVHDAFVRWVPAAESEPWSCRYMAVTLRMSAGQVATIECNADSGGGYEVQVDVTCERGGVSTRGVAQADVTAGWGTRFADAYSTEIAAWVRAAAAGTATGPTARDGWAAQAVVDACIASAGSGGPVAVEAFA